MKRALFTILAALAVSAPAFGADATLDKDHTIAQFTAVHLGLSKVSGVVPMTAGKVTISPDGLPENATATFDVTAENSQNDARDANLKKQYFEADKFPTMSFVEKSVKGTKDNFTVVGDLTMHGTTKSITLTGKTEGSAVIKGKKNTSYTMTGTIDRRDYGMTFGPFLDGNLIVSNNIVLSVEAVAIEQ